VALRPGRLTGFSLDLEGSEEELQEVIDAMGWAMNNIQERHLRDRAEEFTMPFHVQRRIMRSGWGSLTGKITFRQDILA
jgi:hypothetical protein